MQVTNAKKWAVFVGIVGGLALGAVLFLGQWSYAPYHQPPPPPPPPSGQEQEEEVPEIVIRLGNFFFEGPEGRSDSAEEPKVVVKLKNGQRYKLVFENVSATPHQVISPLFAAPEEKIFSVEPNGRVEIEITPGFLTVEDGFPLQFDLSCHVGQGSAFDHFKQGMRALIEVIP